VPKHTRKHTPSRLPILAVSAVDRRGLLNLGHQAGFSRVGFTRVGVEVTRPSSASGARTTPFEALTCR
jgi:hypothetical protein